MPAYLFYLLLVQTEITEKHLVVVFRFQGNLCLFSSLTVLKKNAGGDLSKLSQSRADPEVLCQKVRPKMMFNTVNSHEEIRNRYRSREGVYSERYGPSGKKAKHVEWWW